MASKQCVTYASMWAFEDIGVQEIDNEIKKVLSNRTYNCEYLEPDDALVVKGNLEDFPTKIAAIVSSFIEEQKNKDLLDMPRIRQLDIPVVFQDGGVTASLDQNRDGELLALDIDSDEELITTSHPTTRVTEIWLTLYGGIGCFATGFHGVLTKVAILTGTEITIIDDLKGIQVSGNSVRDVDDALAKLTRIEKSLSCLGNPNVGNVGISPNNDTTWFRIQNYSSLNSVALRRVLMDPAMSLNSGIGQMFVTTSLSFNEGFQGLRLPENLKNPRSISNEPGRSRLWNNFTFQEVGKGDEFLLIESVVEKDHTNIRTASPVISSNHPYLSAEKAKQVNEWVVEGTELEVTSEQPEHPITLPSEAPCGTTPGDATLVQSVKKHPGVKARRVVLSGPAEPSMSPVTKPERVKTTDPVPKLNDAPTPRRRWKMIYEAEPGGSDVLACSPRPNTPCELRDIADSFGNSVVPKPRIPSTFDASKYRLDKPSRLPDNNGRNFIKAQETGKNLPHRMSKNPNEKTELIDVSFPEAIDMSIVPVLYSGQPALIPPSSHCVKNSDVGNQYLETDVLSEINSNVHDLDGLVIKEDRGSPAESNAPVSTQMATAAGGENISEQVKKLVLLEAAFHEQEKETILTNEATVFAASSPRSPRQVNMMLAKKRLEELERPHKVEEQEVVEEVASREFHHAMHHKAPKPSKPNGNATAKSLSKAKRQATLEDAWGIPKKPAKKQPVVGLAKTAATSENVESKTFSLSHTALEHIQQAKEVKGELSVNENVKQLFEALKPTLEAAEYFPGLLTLEAQIGLALIPILPKTYKEGLLSLSEWTQILQPRTGVSALTTKFIEKLTTSGSDVDYIVDLKISKGEGKRRIFEREDSEYSVCYEFHCRFKADQLLIVALDEQGQYTTRKPTEVLGTVNLHFPGHIWDARVAVSGSTAFTIDGNQEFEEAVRYMVDHLWVPPDKSLVRLFTRLPKDKHLTVEQVFMKRWTRHQYIRPDEPSSVGTTTPEASSIKGERPHSATRSVGIETASGHADSVTNSEIAESQNIFLQIMEVQDLILGSSPSDSQALRARCAPAFEMIRKGRQWYEVSLLSSPIEAILKANDSVEVGERTDDWRSSDLLGHDATLLKDNTSPEYSASASSPSAVAAAVGDAGLGNLFRLTKTVVEKMDGIGYWNCGPCVDAARVTAIGSQHAPVNPGKPAASSVGPVINAEPKSLNFDELESIKEIGSVIADASLAKKPNSASSAQIKEQIEREYW
ncbi:hypothetical protein BBP40_007752 [Aspergillus hancockii]|nr:hypothetical protein BBP40_007752 [Aspergillus hancockii]